MEGGKGRHVVCVCDEPEKIPNIVSSACSFAAIRNICCFHFASQNYSIILNKFIDGMFRRGAVECSSLADVEFIYVRRNVFN